MRALGMGISSSLLAGAIYYWITERHLVLALVIAGAGIVGFLVTYLLTKTSTPSVSTPTPSIQVNPQINQNPQINVHVGRDARTTRLEREHAIREEHEELVMQFLDIHRGRPGQAIPFFIEAIAKGVILPERDTADALERLFRKRRVFRSTIENKWGFVYWLSDF